MNPQNSRVLFNRWVQVDWSESEDLTDGSHLSTRLSVNHQLVYTVRKESAFPKLCFFRVSISYGVKFSNHLLSWAYRVLIKPRWWRRVGLELDSMRKRTVCQRGEKQVRSISFPFSFSFNSEMISLFVVRNQVDLFHYYPRSFFLFLFVLFLLFYFILNHPFQSTPYTFAGETMTYTVKS